MINEEEKEKEKIPRRLNEILIERIRKYQTQDTSQLINSPNDEDTNNSYLGGLINFDGEKEDPSEYEMNNELEKITVNDIYVEPYQYNDYDELNEEEEEENEGEKEHENIKNKKEEKNGIKYNFRDDAKSSENIRVLISENYDAYLDKIQKNFRKFENNHFPKVVVDDKKNHKTIIFNNKRNKVYDTKDGEKIIVNEELYPTSTAYLKNRDLFYDMPKRYKSESSEFRLDYSLFEETINNIQLKSMEFIELNSKVSSSISKVLLYCNNLEKYIKGKLEPFNDSINTSYEKVNRDKQFILEIKTKTMENSGNIILKRLKMNNTKKLLSKLNKYKNLKNSMNSLKLLFSDTNNSQEIYDLINVCKEEIEKIKNINKKEKNSESIIEIFENKLMEYKSKNDANMSGELSQVLNQFFDNFLIFEIKNENNLDKNDKIEEYQKYGLSKFVLERVFSTSEKYKNILISICFPSSNEALEKIDKICDYYIDGHLINQIYVQLREIFTNLSEKSMDYILTIFREKLKNNNVAPDNNENDKDQKEKEEKKENGENSETKSEFKDNDNKEKENNNNRKENVTNDKKEDNENKIDEKEEKKVEEINYDDEIFVLLCIILSKNKLIETLSSFIDTISNKVEKSNNIDKDLKESIMKELKEIKVLIKNNIVDKMKELIQKCLNGISSNNNIDLDVYINNYYFVLEMIKDEIQNYDSANAENANSNKLIKIIIKEQKTFIENWAKVNLLRFEDNTYKSWEVLKEIPAKYQQILNVFFSFDIENNCMKDQKVITKFPSDKLELIQKALDEEENNKDNDDEETNEPLLNIKDGDKPQIKIKINQTCIEIIKFGFDLLKMFTLFHKEVYGNILGNMAVIIISHLDYQNEEIYEGHGEFEVGFSEISMSYGVCLLLNYIYEHIQQSDFFVEIATNSKQKLIDHFLEIKTNFTKNFETSKQNIEEILDQKCVKLSLKKLQEIELPNYTPVSGDTPIKEYAYLFLSNLKEIYESMVNSYEDFYLKDIMNKTLEQFFDQFENFIFYGEKIEEENCLKQFRRDMIFLKKNLGFITVLDLSDNINRIDKIMKSVLPESMIKSKKK